MRSKRSPTLMFSQPAWNTLPASAGDSPEPVRSGRWHELQAALYAAWPRVACSREYTPPQVLARGAGWADGDVSVWRSSAVRSLIRTTRAIRTIGRVYFGIWLGMWVGLCCV